MRALPWLPISCLFAAFTACGDDAASTDTRADSAPNDAADVAPDTAPDSAQDATESTPEDVVAPPPLPLLSRSVPTAGATGVGGSELIVLTFEGRVDPEALRGFALTCGGSDVAIITSSLPDERVVVNPGALLEGACTLAWNSLEGPTTLAFSAVASTPVVIAYDRTNLALSAPYPDDVLLVADPATATGLRYAPVPPERPDDVKTIVAALNAEPAKLDGFSPLGPFVIAVPAALEAASLPRTEAASLDPLASIGLFDLDPGSPTYLARVAFDLIIKDEVNPDGTGSHVLLIFPTAPLEARGHYGLVVTNRARIDPSHLLAASTYALTSMNSPAAGPSAHPAARVVAALANASPPIQLDDIALVLSVSVRSTDHLPDDLLAVRAAVHGDPPPEFTITSVMPDPEPGSEVAAIVQGTWEAPDWRVPGDDLFVARNPDGSPKRSGTRAIPFTLTLPDAALAGPVPAIFYMHGNPGSAEREVPHSGRLFAQAGFAVIGFTDLANREYIKGGSVAVFANVVFLSVLQNKRVPEAVNLIDTMDQLSFIRLVKGLAQTLDVLPRDAPDGLPDLDADAPLGFEGISHGSFTGVGLLPYAPEIHAATLVVGGSRYVSTIVHQESDGQSPQHLFETVTAVFPSLTRTEFWVGIALLQAGFDAQEHVLHARYLYREKHPLETTDRASVLQIEGLGDSFVPVYSTRAAAAAMGLPQVASTPDWAPLLLTIGEPVKANIDADTTGAFVQFVPAGLAGFTATAGCAARNLTEGHFCAQATPESTGLRLHFFETAFAAGNPAPEVAPSR